VRRVFLLQLPRDLIFLFTEDDAFSCRESRTRFEQASSSSAADRKQLEELSGRILQMEMDALSAAETARTQTEDRDKHSSAALRDAKERASELEKKFESEQQKWRQQLQSSTAKVQELTAQVAAAEKSSAASSSSAAEAARNADKMLADLKSQLDAATAAASAAVATMDRTSAAAAEAAQREARFAEEISTLKQHMQQQQQAHSDQLSAQQQKYAALEQQLADALKRSESSSTALASALGDADTHKKTAEDLRAQLDEARMQLDLAVKHQASRIADADARMMTLQKDLDQARIDTAAQAKEVTLQACIPALCCCC
jgi:DNA repair exonuclease SbcCD ATPase subunit